MGHTPAKTHHDCGSRSHVGSVAPPRAKRKNQGGQIVLAGVEQCLVDHFLSCLFRAETEILNLIHVLKELSKKDKFNYTIQIVADSQYGKKLENGSWNGMINLVHKELVDIGKCTTIPIPGKVLFLGDQKYM